MGDFKMGSKTVMSQSGTSDPTWGANAPPGMVIEEFMSPCNGSSITVQSGTYTVENVTALVNLTTSHTKVTGSEISYTPPTGTQTVVYEFGFQRTHENDANTISHWSLFLDSDEVTNFRTTISGQGSSYLAGRYILRWAFHIGGSDDTASGRVASWTTAKTIKLTARDYSSSYDVKLHYTGNWDGTSGVFSQPTVGIKAIA